MAERNIAEQLDRAIDALLASRKAKPLRAAAGVAPLLRVAAALRGLPRPEFQSRLKSELERRAAMASAAPAPSQPVAVEKPLPVVVPYLCVRGAAEAINFYKNAFGAVELGRLVLPDGRIAHAEIEIRGALIMMADELPEYGFTSPQALGGAPLKIYVYCDDADALVAQAVAAGAKLTQPVKDEFYGERSGQVMDPYGFTWAISMRKEVLTMAEVERRFQEFMGQQAAPAKPEKSPEEKQTVTAYIAVRPALELIDFVKQAFGAEGAVLGTGSQGGIHSEFRIGDTTLMIGGGAKWRHPTEMPVALHLYVPDADAVYARAVAAGAKSIYPPDDKPYGDREAGVQDLAGNLWFIATHKGASYTPPGMRSLTPTLFAQDVRETISFLKTAFAGAEDVCHEGPDGEAVHGSLRVGNSWVEVGKAQPNWPPMPSMFLVAVDDVDAAYGRALEAGATSVSEPANKPYGAREAAVQDPFGHQWYLAAPVEKKPPRRK